MRTLSELPLRQKVLLSLTVLTGAFILFFYSTNTLSWEALNLMILAYGMGTPLLLLGENTLIDLDDNSIFKIWATIALTFLIGYFLTKDNPEFTIRRSTDFVDRGINKFIVKGSTSSLRALPLFLLCYWPLNYLMKKKTGYYLINTFRQKRWRHDIANRDIEWLDVFINMLLLAVIFMASLIEI